MNRLDEGSDDHADGLAIALRARDLEASASETETTNQGTAPHSVGDRSGDLEVGSG
jgi:hypothetical protein